MFRVYVYVNMYVLLITYMCVMYILHMHVLQTNKTPMHEAANNGHTGAVKILFSYGATVDIMDNVS